MAVPLRIADYFASGDSRITTLNLPEGVEEIGMGAFSFATRLRSVHLPNSMRIIGACAFSSCAELKDLFIPAGITEMRGSFSEVPNLTGITVDDSDGLHLEGPMLIREDTLMRTFPSLLSEKTLYVPEGIRRISGGAFAQCVMLESIRLPKSLQIIEGGAFAGCRSLSHVAIQEGLTMIGGGAFAGDLLLHELTLPDSLTRIGEWCFDGCSSLRHVSLSARLFHPANAFPPYCHLNLRGTASPLPDRTLQDGIREIAPYAFAGIPDLEEITIPDSVVRIGEGAFQLAPELKSVRLPRSLAMIERNAFASLPKLEEIRLPDGIAEIPQGCFWNCPSLRHVTFPKSLRLINRYAFRDCTALESVRLPNGVVTLVSGAFQGCTSLCEIVLPESLRTIGSGDFLNPEMEFPGTFEQCVSLQEVRLPKELDLLNDHTFRGCSKLKWVRLPGRIGCRGKNVFGDCPTVRFTNPSLSVPGLPPEWVRKLQDFRSLKIGFLFALVDEAEPFARALGFEGNIPLHQPFLHNGCRFLVCGSGRANATSGTIRLFRAGCRTIVNIGTAGAYRIDGPARCFVPETVYDGDAFLGNPEENLLDPAGINLSCGGDAPPVITLSSFVRSLSLPFPALIDNEAYAVRETSTGVSEGWGTVCI